MRGRAISTISVMTMGLAALAPLRAGQLRRARPCLLGGGRLRAPMAIAAVLIIIMPGLRAADFPTGIRLNG